MDKQTEQRIRERAYDLWMQNGCLPDRSDEYWLQAEREITGEISTRPTDEVRQDFAEETNARSADEGARTTGKTTRGAGARKEPASEEASLFATSATGTPEEAPPGMAARKGRKKRAAASEPPAEESGTAPAKRKRSARTTS